MLFIIMHVYTLFIRVYNHRIEGVMDAQSIE